MSGQSPYQREFSRFSPVADVLYGVRLFAIGRTTPATLTGQFARSYEWVDGRNTAKCVNVFGVFGSYHPSLTGEPHESPYPPCGCGFWAYTANPENGPVLLKPQATRNVVGVIRGWGRMVAGPLGFRSEFAQIVALAFPETSTAQSRAVVSTAELELAVEIGDELRRVGLSSRGMAHVVSPWSRSNHGAASVVDAIARAYPSVAIFGDEQTMIREFPLSDLSSILADLDDEDATEDES